jgi:hypothetical protein
LSDHLLELVASGGGDTLAVFVRGLVGEDRANVIGVAETADPGDSRIGIQRVVAADRKFRRVDGTEPAPRAVDVSRR